MKITIYESGRVESDNYSGGEIVCQLEQDKLYKISGTILSTS